MASGVIIGLLGLWILLRTISSGNSGTGNLADYLLSLGNTTSATGNPAGTRPTHSGAPSSPAPSASGQPIVRPNVPTPWVGGIGHRNIP